jgi:CelD/BcsL family acetyltransferase involved in cellulose biosynthesis
MLTTTLYHQTDAFTQLAAEWDNLAGRSMTNTPFQSLAYQRAWWQHLGPGNLYTVAVRSGDGDLLAIAPFYQIDGVLYFNGCTEETDYLDLITPAEHAEFAWKAVFDYLTSDAFPAWSALDLCNVPAASPTHQLLPLLAQSRGFLFSSEVHDVCPIIPLPDSFESYLEGCLDKKQRHEIRRKLRRAEGEGLTVTMVERPEELEAAMEQFLALLQKSTPQKAAWLNDGRRAVFHEVAQAAMAAGTLQLMFAQKDGQNAAALFNFDYNGRIWVYNSGQDPEAFGWLSPGVVLTTRAIERAIENGRPIFDFLRGNETYKYRFGAQDTTVHRLQVKRET